MRFERIKPGMRLWDVHSQRMGNTMLRTVGVWVVDVESVDPESQTAVVRWNNNPPERWHASRLKKLRVKRPETVTNKMGQTRLKKRNEAALESGNG